MVSYLKVHVLSQQLFVQHLVLQGPVTMSNPLSFEHFYSLKYQTGVRRWMRKVLNYKKILHVALVSRICRLFLETHSQLLWHS